LKYTLYRRKQWTLFSCSSIYNNVFQFTLLGTTSLVCS
jgi:hypothetical protein